MKQIYGLLLFICVALFSSCNDWLNIEQDTEKKADEMFNNYDGFKGALSGCYSDLAQTNLYGTRLTMSDTEALANLWYLRYKDSYIATLQECYYLSLHQYDNTYAEDAIRSIYGAFFNTILEANMVIKGCHENGASIGSQQALAVVEGEAYAIRALCQMDVLRLFGQLPQNATKQVELPYSEVTSVRDKLQYYAYGDYVKKLEADLLHADSLLKKNDPAVTYSFSELAKFNAGDENQTVTVTIDDDFLQNRKNRLNYWAVKGLEARLYLYVGETQKAYEAATEIINAKAASGSRISVLSSAGDYGKSDPDFSSSSETLFSLYYYDLYDISYPLLSGGPSSDSQASGTVDTSFDPDKQLGISSAMKTDLFAGTNTATDVRSLKMWMDSQTSQGFDYKTIRKYYVKEEGDIPIIRLSEIYLIAIETAPTLDESNALYKTYMESKGVAVKNVFTSKESLKAELEKEYRRELFAEGQMFYYYKRTGATRMWQANDNDITEDDYILPLPSTEQQK